VQGAHLPTPLTVPAATHRALQFWSRTTATTV
jgi:hypothetical protein